jgi:hypothetical protein
VNYARAVNGLPAVLAPNNTLAMFSSLSANNVLSDKYYFSSGGVTSPSSYTYVYNDEGLPVKIQYGPWIVTLEYEKFR